MRGVHAGEADAAVEEADAAVEEELGRRARGEIGARARMGGGREGRTASDCS